MDNDSTADLPEDADFSAELNRFLNEALSEGKVPAVPPFLGEEWEPVADGVADLLTRFEQTLVIEVERPDGGEFYVQFARDGEDIRAETVSNEFIEGGDLPADRVSQLIELGWIHPSPETAPNFSRVFTSPDATQLAWIVLQTLHDVYGADPDDTWSVMPADLVEGATYSEPDDSLPVLEFVEGEDGQTELRPVAEDEGAIGAASPGSSDLSDKELLALFQMPKSVTISGRSSSITNSFVNSIIPVVKPRPAEVRQALEILGMSDNVVCSYCGDQWTEWDHLRPIVNGRRPTGYISEIHNLVPACGKCNQSKGNKPWRTWMFGTAGKSPKSRGIPDIEERCRRLEAYEQWKEPTHMDFAAIVGHDDWATYWARWQALLAQMAEATEHATRIRGMVAAAYAGVPYIADDSTYANGGGAVGWTVAVTGSDPVGPVPKNRAVLEVAKGWVTIGGQPQTLIGWLGATNFRSVEGELTGDELWEVFATTHGKESKHRVQWFVDFPIHAAGRTWLVAKNVWGKKTQGLLEEIISSAGGHITVTGPTGV